MRHVMGCGPSRVRIGIKSNNKRKVKGKSSNGTCAVSAENEDTINLTSKNDEELDTKKKTGNRAFKVPLTPTGMLVQSELTQSQLEFFRVLDEKIESAPDYESDHETLETIPENRGRTSKPTFCWDSPKFRHESLSRHFSANSSNSDKTSEKTSYRTAFSSWNNTSFSEDESSEINSVPQEHLNAKKLVTKILNGSNSCAIERKPTISDLSMDE